MMKVTLKMSWPRGSPAISGRMREQQRDRAAQADPGDEGRLLALEAERPEAEPDRDRPRHEDQEDGERQCPAAAICGNSDGVAKRPKTTNMAICASQVMPSWKRRSASACRSRRLPA